MGQLVLQGGTQELLQVQQGPQQVPLQCCRGVAASGPLSCAAAPAARPAACAAPRVGPATLSCMGSDSAWSPSWGTGGLQWLRVTRWGSRVVPPERLHEVSVPHPAAHPGPEQALGS